MALVLPDPPLSDPIVQLRSWRDEDADQVTAACQDPSIRRFIAIPWPYDRDDALAYFARTRRQWQDGSKAAFAIADVDDPDRVLGAICVALAGAVGNAAYWVAPDARGRGVAGRALRLVTEWSLHRLGLGAVVLEIHPDNTASRRVAESAGYHQAGHLECNTETGARDDLIYSRLVADVAVPGSTDA